MTTFPHQRSSAKSRLAVIVHSPSSPLTASLAVFGRHPRIRRPISNRTRSSTSIRVRPQTSIEYSKIGRMNENQRRRLASGARPSPIALEIRAILDRAFFTTLLLIRIQPRFCLNSTQRNLNDLTSSSFSNQRYSDLGSNFTRLLVNTRILLLSTLNRNRHCWEYM